MLIFRPFSEGILNISNLVSEFCIFFVFGICAVNLMNIPSNFHDYIDEILVALINTIMGAQMAASILILIKTVTSIIKAKFRNKDIPVVPLSPSHLKGTFDNELKPTQFDT